VLLPLALAFSAACASTAGQLQERFARERGCPEAQVAVREKGGTIYEASGCGRSAEYSCGSFTSKDNARTCEERGLARQAPTMERQKPPEDVRYQAPK
jgi:hypothetical protein